MMSLSKNRLPETDMARIAPMSTDQKWVELRRMRGGRSPYSYRPARKHQPDALNIQRGLPMTVSGPSCEALVANVRRDSTTDVEADANAEVISLFYNFIHKNGIEVVEEHFAPLKLAGDYSVSYWLNAILRWDDRLLVINTDFRRSTGYSKLARRFAFSAANERVRKLGVDYASIELGLLRFPADKEGVRSVDLVTDKGIEMFSYEELATMTEETLSIWHQVVEERARGARREAANDDDTLFGWAKTRGGG